MWVGTRLPPVAGNLQDESPRRISKTDLRRRGFGCTDNPTISFLRPNRYRIVSLGSTANFIDIINFSSNHVLVSLSTCITIPNRLFTAVEAFRAEKTN